MFFVQHMYTAVKISLSLDLSMWCKGLLFLVMYNLSLLVGKKTARLSTPTFFNFPIRQQKLRYIGEVLHTLAHIKNTYTNTFSYRHIHIHNRIHFPSQI